LGQALGLEQHVMDGMLDVFVSGYCMDDDNILHAVSLNQQISFPGENADETNRTTRALVARKVEGRPWKMERWRAKDGQRKMY
jgi:hypothetical protein